MSRVPSLLKAARLVCSSPGGIPFLPVLVISMLLDAHRGVGGRRRLVVEDQWPVDFVTLGRKNAIVDLCEYNQRQQHGNNHNFL